jgi:hypothetical protein
VFDLLKGNSLVKTVLQQWNVEHKNSNRRKLTVLVCCIAVSGHAELEAD